MSAYDATNTTVESREKERQRIAKQIESFINHGGKIECLESHLANVKMGPGKATGSEASFY